jgi:hypothetical protein
VLQQSDQKHATAAPDGFPCLITAVHFWPLAAIKKTQSLPAMEHRAVLGKITMRTRWSIAIHDENQSEDSLLTEDHFVHFADVHQRMKRNKDKVFVVRIPKTAKPMEVQAFNNLRRLGYRVEIR